MSRKTTIEQMSLYLFKSRYSLWVQHGAHIYKDSPYLRICNLHCVFQVPHDTAGLTHPLYATLPIVVNMLGYNVAFICIYV